MIFSKSNTFIKYESSFDAFKVSNENSKRVSFSVIVEKTFILYNIKLPI